MTGRKLKKIKVLVAMSGGVDSSVAAALLKERGFDVSGCFIKNWSQTKDVFSGECSWRSERRDAMRAAAVLDIPFMTFDFEDQYRRLVVEAMIKAYKAGYTPNPDVLCNEYVKFGMFWQKAKLLGFEAMATGHYARIKSDGRQAHLYKGLDKDKDQSYFLYRAPQEALSHVIFPIGHLQKSAVRRKAAAFGLPTAEKPDSQGICFIGKINFQDFLKQRIKSKPGRIISDKGEVLGEHQGLHLYTIGQRQQIKVAGRHAWYAADKDLKKNILTVVGSDKHPWLQAKRLRLGDLHWISGQSPSLPLSVQVQVRYRQTACAARLIKGSKAGEISLEFKQPVKAAAIGQSAVVYRGSECLGGGVIRQIDHL